MALVGSEPDNNNVRVITCVVEEEYSEQMADGDSSYSQKHGAENVVTRLHL